MALDFFQTHKLLMSVEQLTPPVNFLRDRYFPTNDDTDIFATDDVLVEYRDGNKKIAPFVAPRKGGITILRDGYTMKRYTPPFIAPRRILTTDELKKRGFGEALFPTLTPEQRQNAIILKDAKEMGEMIARREEVTAAETMIKNGCIMKHYADDMETVVEEKEIRFYEGENNPAVYAPTVKWGNSGAKIMQDMQAMIFMLTSRGLPATEMIVAPDVADIIINDPTIQNLMDIRNFDIGSVAPKLEGTPGAAVIAVLNIYGRYISVISYDETYEADDGSLTPFIPSGTVIMTSPNVGRTLYGAVTQLEQNDLQFHTYAAKRVPKYVADASSNTRTLTLTSCPLLIPNNKNPWVTAKVTA